MSDIDSLVLSADDSSNDLDFSLDIHDDIAKISFESNVDLREYSKQVEEKLSDLEDQTLKSYMESAPKVARLYNQLTDCDSILERMENILTNFHKSLGNISTDIQDLQRRSVEMHQKLQNRQSVRGEISQYLSDIVIPEPLIQHILFTDVTEQDFLENLHELDHKIKFVYNQSSAGYASSNDVISILMKLTTRAVIRLREYLLSKIASMRKPYENFHVPQSQMLKLRFYMEFLLTHDRATANEIKADYIATMSKVYFSYFKEYITKLSKLQIDLLGDKDDLLGKKLEDTVSVASSSSVSMPPLATSKQVGVFSLGDRAMNCFLESTLDSPVMIPHLAAKNDSKYPIEVLFRSSQYALFDCACREYFFLTDFFLTVSSPEVEANPTCTEAVFEELLGKTVLWVYKQTETQIQLASSDALGLLLCIQILHGLQRMATAREVAILEVYWSNLLSLLWGKLLERLDQHCGSLRNVDTGLLAQACQALLPSNAFSAEDAGKQPSLAFKIPICAGPELAAAVRNATSIPLLPKAVPLVRPHPLSRRWAEFAAALHAIGHGAPGTPWIRISRNETPTVSPPSHRISVGSRSVALTSSSNDSSNQIVVQVPLDGRILLRLSQMQDQYEAALNRLAMALPRLRLRMIFLINNLDLVITVLTEQGHGESKEVERCRDAITKYTQTFIDQALLPFFGSMLTFIKAAQDTNKKEGEAGTAVGDETRITHIIRGFNIDWRNAIEKIHSEILGEFANFTIANQIFQALLTQLIHYYHEFQSALNTAPYNNMSIRIQLVGVHEIVNEIKKFVSNSLVLK